MVIIDPMHNLMLGTAKHVMSTWIKEGILTDDKFEEIQTKVHQMRVPSDVGRIPGKIATKFSGFTADEWKNWTNIYSLFALFDQIPDDHYTCWQHFVRASRLLCQRYISDRDIKEADEHLMNFCQAFENIFGAGHCTMNMHLHMHLKSVLEDFGPVYSYWLYGFERYNGILGNMYTNNRDVPVQLMRRFIKNGYVKSLSWPQGFTRFQEIIGDGVAEVGTIGETEKVHGHHLHELKEKALCSDVSLVSFEKQSLHCTVGDGRRYILDEHDILEIQRMYTYLYLHRWKDISHICEEYDRVFQGGEVFDINNDKVSRCAYIAARTFDGNGQVRGGIVRQLLVSDAFVSSLDNTMTRKRHLIARVDWFEQHEQEQYYGPDIILCSTEVDSTVCKFIPIQRISSRCAGMKKHLRLHEVQDCVIVLVPLNHVSVV